MAERRMLRQVMSPSDIYAHAESICDMLREQYGSYDADSLEEVVVDDVFAQRLKARGYDLLGEGDEVAPPTPRRDNGRMENREGAGMRRPESGDRSLPMRRPGNENRPIPMRRRETSTEGGVPLRRPDRTSGDSTPMRRRDAGAQGDGSNQMRRRDSGAGDGVSTRRRDTRTMNDGAASSPALEPPTSSASSPRRSWDSVREETGMVSRRENVTFGRAPEATTTPVEDVSPPMVDAPTPIAAAAEDVAPPTVPVPEAPVVEASEAAAPVGDVPAGDAPLGDVSMVDAPAKPAPRTRRTTRSRTKVDPDPAASESV